MPYTVGQRVWFKRAGSTPFVTGDATSASTVFDSSLGGRGDPSVTFSGSSFGVATETLYTSGVTDKLNTGVENTEHTISGTFKFPGGESLGVREGSLSNPLAPVSGVSVLGPFDGPTSAKLFGNQDDGETDSGNTIGTLDPNFPTGRPNAAVATGTSIPLSGSHEFANETINVAGTTVGFRTPSSEESAGIVIEVVSDVTLGNKSPDGTVIRSGVMYWVNWGASSVSNPNRAKWNNRFRVQLHAEEDLISA